MSEAQSSDSQRTGRHASRGEVRPWAAFSAVIIGFFMLMVDTTIVTVANPSIMRGLNTDISTVIWVTSAYLLAFAVPLLFAGRLGDRYGIKWVYLVGLVVFTAASAWGGFATSIEMLIMARAVQGLGGSLMSPQTMAIITRVFPPNGRGKAMAFWGATSGVAMLVGPVLGGFLVDAVGWEWIFFVNLPIGILGFILALKYVPDLETRPHRFDVLGVILSGVGTFLIIFGIEEGGRYDWGVISGWVSIPGIIILGVVFMVAFVWWESFTKVEPLVPLGLFRDRNFSVGNLVITAVGFTVASQAIPMSYFFQIARGMTPTQAGLMQTPMAVVSLLCAPLVGRVLDFRSPRGFAVFGLGLMSLVIATNGWLFTFGADAPIWAILVMMALLGLASSGVWGPIGNITTRNLPPQMAGAGSGVYNATRQFGSVLGAAGMAAIIQSRLTAQLGFDFSDMSSAAATHGTGALPAQLVGGFSLAMGQSLLLPCIGALVGAILSVFLEKPKPFSLEDSMWEAPQVKDS